MRDTCAYVKKVGGKWHWKSIKTNKIDLFASAPMDD